MRKRHIKSIAHWTIMSLLLLFPVLMVGVSAFANDEQIVNVDESYQYETNDVNSKNDLVNGNIYLLNLYDIGNVNFTDVDFYVELESDYIYYHFNNTEITLSNGGSLSFLYSGSNSEDTNELIFRDSNSSFSYTDFDTIRAIYFIYNSDTFEYEISSSSIFNQFITDSDYLGEFTKTVDIQNASYKQEVNNWANGFKNLPVNSWYKSLLNVIGIGETTNSVMNVIYVYPLYVLWVYILDLIVDCLLLIINFGHDALQRLGADNE